MTDRRAAIAKPDADAAMRGPTSSTSVPDLVFQRWLGTFDVDEWGLDHDLASVAQRVASLRWRIEVSGLENLPAGAAMLVHNRRVGVSEPLVLASGLWRSAGRIVRFSGVPDVAPISSVLSRVGGVPATDADRRSLFRAGELVSVPLDRELHYRALAGGLDASIAFGAIDAGVPVVPVAVIGNEIGFRWRILIGEAIATGRRRNALAATEFATHVSERVQALLLQAL